MFLCMFILFEMYIKLYIYNGENVIIYFFNYINKVFDIKLKGEMIFFYFRNNMLYLFSIMI